jgi:hypothetical protein
VSLPYSKKNGRICRMRTKLSTKTSFTISGNHPDKVHWIYLFRLLKKRSKGNCEFCQIRKGEQIHHRSYEHYGKELEHEVMWVCQTCHSLIHNGLVLTKPVRYSKDSLWSDGDKGLNDNAIWREYLKKVSIG